MKDRVLPEHAPQNELGWAKVRIAELVREVEETKAQVIICRIRSAMELIEDYIKENAKEEEAKAKQEKKEIVAKYEEEALEQLRCPNPRICRRDRVCLRERGKERAVREVGMEEDNGSQDKRELTMTRSRAAQAESDLRQERLNASEERVRQEAEIERLRELLGEDFHLDAELG